MTAHHIEPGEPLIPRPERTPAALRVALAQVAPHRLPDMERQKDEAIALAARAGSLGPITQFLETWAEAIEIARIPLQPRGCGRRSTRRRASTATTRPGVTP